MKGRGLQYLQCAIVGSVIFPAVVTESDLIFIMYSELRAGDGVYELGIKASWNQILVVMS